MGLRRATKLLKKLRRDGEARNLLIEEMEDKDKAVSVCYLFPHTATVLHVSSYLGFPCPDSGSRLGIIKIGGGAFVQQISFLMVKSSCLLPFCAGRCAVTGAMTSISMHLDRA
jgi:hypothetical protein